MKYRQLALGSLATLGLLVGVTSFTPAQMLHEEGMGAPRVEQTSQFQRIEQPLWLKAAVTAGGFGLIGLELWWFVFSQPKRQRPADV
jgi:plastocyanin domain-containing protein